MENNNNKSTRASTLSPYDALLTIPKDNLAINLIVKAILELSGGGTGGSTDLSAYAKKSGLYHDATTAVDLESETQSLNTRLDAVEAIDASTYAKKSGLYKDATTAVNLETQCQSIETRVSTLETPAALAGTASRTTEQDKYDIAQMVFQKIINDKDFFNAIIKEVMARMHPSHPLHPR